MKLSYLKQIRVVVALFFLFLVGVAFLDFRGALGSSYHQWAVALQFVPSVLKTITVPGLLGFGFVVALLFTVLFGRVYCSAVCPLGILQDFISWISRKVKKKSRYRFSKAWNWVRYPLLGVVVLALLASSMTLLTLLDPYSLFGRITTYLIKPVVVLVNNLGAELLTRRGIYSWLYAIDLPAAQWEVLGMSWVFVVLLIIMAWTRGRLYCNSVCPVGTFLGMLSRFSLVKIELDKKQCTQCGRCARVCKSECISIKEITVDASRCVTCFNCLTVCPEAATHYRIRATRAISSRSEDRSQGGGDGPALSKRNFVALLGLTTAAVVGSGTARESLAQGRHRHRHRHGKNKHGDGQYEQVPVIKESAVSPPGSKSVERFNDLCTGCGLCVSACPTHVLQPSFLQYGMAGMMQPHMDFSTGLCNFDCTVCGEVCPTGAILPITKETKHETQIGRVVYIRPNCIVKTDGTDCGACSEHCPTKAVQMMPFGELFIPKVDPKICVGCGACEYACPVEGHKAIYVDGNRVHQLALKPKTEKATIELGNDEFPF